MSSTRTRVLRVIVAVLLTIGAVVVSIPFLWMLSGSVKPESEVLDTPPTLWPREFTWSNYTELFTSLDFGVYLRNTLLVVALSFFGLLLRAMAGLVSAFNIFLFRQFFTTIPNELLEAARLDGAGEIRTFVQVVLPVSGPILAIQAILTFIASWNSFLWPLIVATRRNTPCRSGSRCWRASTPATTAC